MFNLKYLFVAKFADGNLIEQFDENDDVSSVDPTKSKFYDVCEYEKKSPLVKFSLERTDKAVCYSVDLTDGHFDVWAGDVVPFRFHESCIPLHNFRLIFFRRHKHVMNANFDELSHQVIYRMGWQANDSEGRNVQYVMEID